MGEGLKRVAAQCGGLKVTSGGKTVRYNAQGEKKRTTTEIINDYQTVYRQLYGRDINVNTKSKGWLSIRSLDGSFEHILRPSQLAEFADRLRKRL